MLCITAEAVLACLQIDGKSQGDHHPADKATANLKRWYEIWQRNQAHNPEAVSGGCE